MACSLLVSMLVALVPPSEAQTAPPAGTVPPLHVEGNTLRDPNGRKVVLRGVSLPGLEAGAGPKGDPAPQGILSRIDLATDASQGWHAKIVRLPVDFPGGAWQANPDEYFSTLLDPAVRHCVAKKVYCIIDLHYIGDYDQARMQQVREFWRYVAPRYANVPNVFYELYNEPVQLGGDASWGTWRNTIQPVVDEIRSVAPENIILVGSPRYDTGLRPQELRADPVRGTNLVYVAHMYPASGPQHWDHLWGAATDVVPVCVTEWGWDADWPEKDNPIVGTTSGWGLPFIHYMDSKPGVACDTAWAFDPYWGSRMFKPGWQQLTGGENGMGQTVKDRLAAKAGSDQPTGGATGSPPPASPLPQEETSPAPSPMPSADDAPGTTPPPTGGGDEPDGDSGGILAGLRALLDRLMAALRSFLGQGGEDAPAPGA
jgi:endoglucanase